MTNTGSDQYFSEVADKWDEMRATFFSEAVREAALELADIRPGSSSHLTAVDLGAGTGFLTEALLAAGATVFAVDASPQRLARLSA